MAEVLTLIQTKKSRHVPIVLVGAEFWEGLLSWFRNTLVPTGVISAKDLGLMQVIDDPDQVLEAVLQFYEDARQPKNNRPKASRTKTGCFIFDV